MKRVAALVLMILIACMMFASAQAEGPVCEYEIRFIGIPWGSTPDVVCQKLYSSADIKDEPDGTPDVNGATRVWPAALETVADFEQSALYEVPVAASKTYTSVLNKVGQFMPYRIRCMYWNEPVDGVLTTITDANQELHLAEPRLCGIAFDYHDFANEEEAQAAFDTFCTTYVSVFGEGCDISTGTMPGHVWYGQENTACSVRRNGTELIVEYGVTNIMDTINELVALAAK